MKHLTVSSLGLALGLLPACDSANNSPSDATSAAVTSSLASTLAADCATASGKRVLLNIDAVLSRPELKQAVRLASVSDECASQVAALKTLSTSLQTGLANGSITPQQAAQQVDTAVAALVACVKTNVPALSNLPGLDPNALNSADCAVSVLSGQVTQGCRCGALDPNSWTQWSDPNSWAQWSDPNSWSQWSDPNSWGVWADPNTWAKDADPNTWKNINWSDPNSWL